MAGQRQCVWKRGGVRCEDEVRDTGRDRLRQPCKSSRGCVFYWTCVRKQWESFHWDSDRASFFLFQKIDQTGIERKDWRRHFLFENKISHVELISGDLGL